MSEKEPIKIAMLEVFKSFTPEEQEVILNYHLKVAEIYGTYKSIIRIFDDKNERTLSN